MSEPDTDHINERFIPIFVDLGIEDAGVDAIEIRFYYEHGALDTVTAVNNEDGTREIRYLIDGRGAGYDVESDNERNDT